MIFSVSCCLILNLGRIDLELMTTVGLTCSDTLLIRWMTVELREMGGDSRDESVVTSFCRMGKDGV